MLQPSPPFLLQSSQIRAQSSFYVVVARCRTSIPTPPAVGTVQTATPPWSLWYPQQYTKPAEIIAVTLITGCQVGHFQMWELGPFPWEDRSPCSCPALVVLPSLCGVRACTRTRQGSTVKTTDPVSDPRCLSRQMFLTSTLDLRLRGTLKCLGPQNV